MKTEEINRMAMQLIGDLQMIPGDQAFEKAKQYLGDAWNGGENEKEIEISELKARIYRMDAINMWKEEGK